MSKGISNDESNVNEFQSPNNFIMMPKDQQIKDRDVSRFNNSFTGLQLLEEDHKQVLFIADKIMLQRNTKSRDCPRRKFNTQKNN